MSIKGQHRSGWVIVLTVVIALALSILPLPAVMQTYMPEWTVLVLIYWSMALPHRVGVGVCWGIGLLLDVLRDTLLGQYALSLALIAFLTMHLHQRVRVFPLWQQSITILVLISVNSLLVFWVRGIQGQTPDFWMSLASPLTSAALWPMVFVLMRHLRRYYQVN